MGTSLYDLSFKSASGKNVDMASYKGKTLLVVNTATKCGLAPQFEELELLSQKYKNDDFVVLGFPCNQFADQEPETNESVVNVCKLNFGVTFLLSEIIKVNGLNVHPIFKFLKDNSSNGMFGSSIKWNFTKFLISKDGNVIKRYAPTVRPTQIEADIVDFLK